MTQAGDTDKLKKTIKQEKRHIDETLRLHIDTLSKESPTKNDQVAMSLYVHNIYMGIENILRRILDFKKIKIVKTTAYHKELLGSSAKNEIVSNELYDILSKYASFRHRVVHGYGYMLEPEKMRFLIDNAESTADRFFSELKQNGYL